MKTYVPHYSGTKLFCALLGLAVALFGAASIYTPLRLFFRGTRTTAEITTVIVSRPGEPDQILTSREGVKPDTSRTATFHFHARYRAPNGAIQTGLLDLAYHATPNNTIGERFQVAYDPAAAALPPHLVKLVPIYDPSTWTFGAFFIFTGLFLAVVQFIYLFYSRTPILLPDEPSKPCSERAADAPRAISPD